MTQNTALSILKTGANVFLTGEPGSGKTHTVNEFVAYLREHGINPAITASTGIAATHIGGFTIHSWSGIGVRRYLSKWDLDLIAQNKRVVGHVTNAEILLIDEVSMLSANTLSMADAVCREIRRNTRPFGGLQVVLVGDFFQLPPISKRREEQEQDIFGFGEENQAQFAYNSPVWEALHPITCYLSEQHRQEDAAFLDLLSAIRQKSFSPDHRQLLRTRYSPIPRGTSVQIYSHNADVDHINQVELAKLSGEEEVFDMITRGPEKLVTSLKRGCLSPERLALKVGARVIFTKNDVARRRFMNGTIGIVHEFSKDSREPVVKTNSGRLILAGPTEWSLQDGNRVLARIAQVPLRLAWAITVHKSQGMSLDSAHMDLSDTFEYGQGYVALSRLRTLAGLSLAGLNDRALEVHPEVSAKDSEFRKESEEAEKTFANIPPLELKLLHQNFLRSMGGKIPADAPRREGRKEDGREEKGKFAVGKAFSVDKIRGMHQNAYQPWSKEDDATLIEKYNSGVTIIALAKEFGRGRGAITSRLAKLV